MTPGWDASLPQGYPPACFQVMDGADSVIKMSCLNDKQVQPNLFQFYGPRAHIFVESFPVEAHVGMYGS